VKKTETWVVLNDIQIPFHDVPVLANVLSFIQDLKPQGVILNGDVVECYAISNFTKDPMEPSSLTNERMIAGDLMNRLSHVKHKIWLGGNHEDRLRSHVWRNRKEWSRALGVLGVSIDVSFESLFTPRKYGFKYTPYGTYHMLGKLMVTHGEFISKHSAFSAKMHMDRFGTSVLHGHTHRLGIHYRTDMKGVHGAWENGCLCVVNAREWVHFPNWQQGFAIVNVAPDGMFNVQQIPILPDKTFMFGGLRVGKEG